MNIREKLAQIKKLIFDTATPGAASYALKDGTPCTISQLAAGGDMLINGTPATAGEYTLQDGCKVTVGDGGKISAVQQAQAAADPGAPIADILQNGTQVTYDKLDVGGIVKDIIGNPVATGTYTLMDNTTIVVGDGGMITSVTPDAEPPMDEAMKTAAGRAKFASSIANKFAAGGDQTQNIITCLTAVMNYCFGWDIQQAEQNATKQQAIQILQQGFAAQKTALDEAKATIARQETIIKGMFELMEEYGMKPNGEPAPEPPKAKFSFNKVEQRKTGLSKFAAAMEEMKTN